MQDKSSGPPRQLPVDSKSPTPLVDAIQLARQGYAFSDSEIDQILVIAKARRQARLREDRRAVASAAPSAEPLEGAIERLNELLIELPYLIQGIEQQPQRPAPQPRNPNNSVLGQSAPIR